MVKASSVIRSEEARAAAASQFAKAKQDEEAIWQERTRLRAVEAEKMTRLRELRLAKEAAEKAAAALPKPVTPRRKTPASAPRPTASRPAAKRSKVAAGH